MERSYVRDKAVLWRYCYIILCNDNTKYKLILIDRTVLQFVHTQISNCPGHNLSGMRLTYIPNPVAYRAAGMNDFTRYGRQFTPSTPIKCNVGSP